MTDAERNTAVQITGYLFGSKTSVHWIKATNKTGHIFFKDWVWSRDRVSDAVKWLLSFHCIRGEAQENVGLVGCYSNAGVQCTCVRANSIYHIFKVCLKKGSFAFIWSLFKCYFDRALFMTECRTNIYLKQGWWCCKKFSGWICISLWALHAEPFSEPR